MEEVVVVGYGVTKKRDLAGAITSIKTGDVKAGVVADMSQMLKGRASGVQVRQNSLEPGGNVSIRVRGASSVSAENEPLYVIDGFQTDNMSQISIDDIESIEILKMLLPQLFMELVVPMGLFLSLLKKVKKELLM